MRPDHAALVEQRQPAGGFQHPLDHEHHIGTAGIVLVEAQRNVVLIGPRQDAVAELGDLHPVADDDGVLADQIDTADVAVEIDAHARPVQSRRHLLDMGRLAGAVIAGDDDAPVLGKTSKDGKRGRLVETIVWIDVRHVLVGIGIGRHLHVAVEAEQLADRYLHVGQASDFLRYSGQLILRGLAQTETGRSVGPGSDLRELSRKPRERESRRLAGQKTRYFK